MAAHRFPFVPTSRTITASSARLSAVVAAFVVLLAPAAARADTFEVTHTGDSGPGSLRSAIAAANVSEGPDVVDATGVNGVIELESALPALFEDIEVRGPEAVEPDEPGDARGEVTRAEPGSAGLTVRRAGEGEFRIFTVERGVLASISGITIANGRVSGESGGAILNRGELFLRRAAVRDSYATSTGGGIANDGRLTLIDTTVTGNWARGGGGIAGSGYTMVRSSTVTGNEAAIGGGITGDEGTLYVVNSTVHRNSADRLGGGIETFGELVLDASTVSGNSAPEGASIRGGGEAELTISNTILADPRGGGEHCAVAAHAPTSTGYNLADDASCALTDPTDRTNTDPMLGPLIDNGGPTETMAPLPGSPAIDAGLGRHKSDQRGLPRVVELPDRVAGPVPGNRADIGAVELQRDEVGKAPRAGALNLGELKRNPKRGTAKLIVTVPGPGTVTLARTGKLRAATARASAAGRIRLAVRPRGKAKRRLARAAGSRVAVRVKVEVAYAQPGGERSIRTKRVKLVRRG